MSLPLSFPPQTPPTCSASSSTHMPIISTQIDDFFIIVIDRQMNKSINRTC